MRDLEQDAVVDAAGTVVLDGRHYQDETFPTLLPAAGGSRLVLSRSTFERCRTEQGFFWTSAVTLRDVVLVDLDCGDALHISAQAELTRVTVAGTRPRMLWIRPDEDGGEVPEGAAPPAADEAGAVDGPALDISRFEGEVSITGLPVDRVVIDPVRHVRVPRALLDEVDWAGLGLSPASYWRLLARKVQADGANEGIYSMPPPGSPLHSRAQADLEVLRAHGHLT